MNKILVQLNYFHLFYSLISLTLNVLTGAEDKDSNFEHMNNAGGDGDDGPSNTNYTTGKLKHLQQQTQYKSWEVEFEF